MRTLSATELAALAAPNVAAVLLLEMLYSPTPLRANSSAVDIDFGGQTYLRTGSLGNVDPVRDTTGEITALKFALSGVPSGALALALGSSARNVPTTLRLAILDPDTHAVLGAPVIFAGIGDQTPVTEGETSSTIAVTAQHLGTVLRRRKPFRNTDADQQRRYAGDTSRRFVVTQAQKKDVWPSADWGRR